MQEKTEEKRKSLLTRKIKIKWWVMILACLVFGGLIMLLEILIIK